MRKKLLAGLLALCMMLALVPATALAAPDAVAKPGIKYAGFRAAASDSGYNEGTKNCFYISLNLGTKEAYDEYVFTYQCAGGDETEVTQFTAVKESTYTYARWSATDGTLKPGECTIKVYAKGDNGSKSGDALGETKLTLVEYTLNANDGKISFKEGSDSKNGGKIDEEGKKFVVFAEPYSFYFYAYTDLIVTHNQDAENKKFIGWTTDEAGSETTGNYLPKDEKYVKDNACNLYAQYGTPKITKFTMKAAENSPNVDKIVKPESAYFIEYKDITLEAGTADENGIAKIEIKNEGNQPVDLPNITSFGPFSVESNVTAKEAGNNDQPYIRGSYVVLPQNGNSVTFTFSLPANASVGTHSHSYTFRVASYQICTISITATVTKGAVNLTLKENQSKEYGKTMTSEDLAKEAKVEWTNKDGKTANAPQFSDLGITLESEGIAANASVNETDGYEIKVAGEGSYEVHLQGSPKLKVTKATPTPSVDTPEVSVMKGHSLDDVTLGVTFTNPNNSETVPGTLTWTSTKQWDETGVQESVPFKFTPEDTVNYNEYNGNAKVTVTEKYVANLTPTVPDPTETYNGQSHPVAFTATKAHNEDAGELGNVTVKYEKKNGEDTYEASTNEAPTDAGTYKVTATMAETDNFASVSATTTLTIAPKELTVSGATIAEKTYDGATTGTVTDVALSGIVNSDEVSVDAGSCTAVFDSADAGTARNVTVSGIALTGEDKDNYFLSGDTYHTTAEIKPAVITVALAKGAVTKEYGELLNLTADNFTFTGVQNEDVISAEYISTGEEVTANAGDYPITVTLGTDNYTFAGGKSFTIDKGIEVKKVPLNSLKQSVSVGLGHKGSLLSSVHSLSGSFTNPHNDEDVPGTLEWTTPKANMGTEETYVASWTFTPTSTTNYESGTLTGTVTITLVDKYVVNMEVDSSSLTATYNGQPHPVTARVLACEGHDELPNIGSIDDSKAAELSSSIKYRYRLKQETVTMADDAPSTEWSETVPTDAGTYEVEISIEVPDELADGHVGNIVTATLTIAKATPNANAVTVAPVLEGTPLSQVTPASNPTGVNGQALEGGFVWVDQDSVITENSMSYQWNFYPEGEDAVNYLDVTGHSTITLADDPRTVTATVYNLPNADGYTDYAVITGVSGTFTAGGKVAFYSDAACTDPVSEVITISEITTPLRIEVPLDADALSANGGTIYTKVEGKKTTASPVSYARELGFTPSESVTIYVGETYTGSVSPTDSTYVKVADSEIWTLAESAKDILEAVEGATNQFKGLKTGETAVTVSVSFNHPDPDKNEHINIVKTLTVVVTNRPVNTGGSSNNTVTNPDGSTTTTKKNADGSTTETTKQTDGTVTEKVTQPDGSATEKTTTPEGVVGQVETDANGAVKAAEVVIPEVKDDGRKAVVTAPIEVPAAKDVASAPEVTVTSPSPAKVEIPVEEPKPGVVAYVVDENGKETLLRDCVVGENGVILNIEGDVTLKIVDNTATFADVEPVNHWSANAVEFVAARELFNGTGNNNFEPDTEMNRGMLVTVLYRLAYEPQGAGEEFPDVAANEYYADAVAWAQENDIVNGYDDGTFRPEDDISRDQMVTILYRYAQKAGYSVEKTVDLSKYEDAGEVESYAAEAMAWAVGSGLIYGEDATHLAPLNGATRAEVATILMRFCAGIIN